MYAFWHRNIWDRRLSVFAWSVLCFVTGLTVVCIFESMNLTDLVKKAAEDVDAWFRCQWNIPVSPAVFLLSLLAVPYRFFLHVAEGSWIGLKTIVQYVNPVFETGFRKELFTVFGLAGSVIPAVYNARSRRLRGVLVSDMTKYCFPLYGIVMLENLVLSIAGRFVVGVEDWKYLLPAAIATTCYSIILLLATGLYGRVSQWFAAMYIREQSRIFRPQSPDNPNQEQMEERAEFLADLSVHVAGQLAAASTPYCITGDSLKREIRMAAEFIVCEAVCSNLKHSKPGSILNEYDLFFSALGLDKNTACDELYFDLPVAESARNTLFVQMEMARQFWKLILDQITGLSDQARAVCRIFDAMEHSGSRLVMTCGLIVALYKRNQSQGKNSYKRDIDYCTHFASELWKIFSAEKLFAQNQKIPKSDVMLYAEMLILIWNLSQAEQYLQGAGDCEDLVPQYLCEFWHGDHALIARNLVMNKPIQKYLSLAMCMLCQLPSPANRPLYPAQVKRLRGYILSQKNRIGV